MVGDSDLGRTVAGAPQRTWRPGERLLVLYYTALLIAVGALIIGVRSLDIVWTLMMLPVVVASVLYARRVYLVMIMLYAAASALVIIFAPATDPGDSTRTIAVFLAGLVVGCEALYRFTRIRDASSD